MGALLDDLKRTQHSRYRCAHSWNILQHSKRNFLSPCGHVISSIYVTSDDRGRTNPLFFQSLRCFTFLVFFWPTFRNVRAPNVGHLKTAVSLKLFKSYSSKLPWASWHVVYWGNGKVAVYVIFILRNKMNENVKKMQKKAGNWGYKNVLTRFSHLLSWSLLYSRLRLSTLVSSSLEVKWYAASWFLNRWAKA